VCQKSVLLHETTIQDHSFQNFYQWSANKAILKKICYLSDENSRNTELLYETAVKADFWEFHQWGVNKANLTGICLPIRENSQKSELL